ncbi:hypothetical protein LOD99_4998 [Oopsacas minuta]|uniref:PIPK domain-containing protein n=1 Tax=Oopsacas minuta TaxID=111878 RepID=A0AAV7JSM3_9METZ|nr:hypothetical protein LOD99_4998 [Oopsacas minuta]
MNIIKFGEGIPSIPFNVSHKIKLNSTLGDLFNEDSYRYFTLIYFIGSLFSMVSLFATITFLLIDKPLRKHPASLVVGRVFSDLIVSTAHVVFFCRHASYDQLFKEELRVFQYACQPYSAAIEFGMLSGYTWNIIFAVDLLLAVRRPFRLHGSYIKYYHTAVWIPSLVITILFTILPLTEWQPYGMSMFFFCWVNVADLTSYTITSILIYFLPTSVMFCFGLVITIRVLYIMKKVALFSPDFKGNIAKLSLGMLFGLGVEWVVALVIWIIDLILIYVLRNEAEQSFGFYHDGAIGAIEYFQVALTYIYSLLHSTRGCIILVAWVYPIYTKNRTARKNKFAMENKVNTRARNRTGEIGRKSRSTSSTQGKTRTGSDERSTLINSENEALVEYMFNSELRRLTVVCINYSILDSAKTAQSQIAGDSHGTFQHHITIDQVIQKSMSMKRHEIRTLQIPAPFMYHKFEFINFSPLVFKNLRDLRGIDEGEFMKSFPLQDNETAAMMEKFTEGKSGSFFFFSYDKKYIVKTINTVELNFMIRNLDPYYRYLKDNPNSLLTRYYGLVKLRFMSEQEFIMVVIMENVFYLEEGLILKERYDLKGSVTNRQTVKRGMGRPRNKTMKDLDMDSYFKFKDISTKKCLLSQLELDTEFLQTHGAMDYSLLVGVTATSEGENTGYSTSMQNNIFNESEQSLPEDVDSSFQWVNYNPQNLHWYRNGARREHAPSSITPFTSPIINPAQSLFSQFRKGYFKVPADKILTRRPSNVETHEKESCFLYIGIIDMLQPYNIEKKIETLIKTKIRFLKEENISSVQPYLYRARFMQFMRNSVFD